MPSRRMSTYHLQLEFRKQLMRATINEAEGLLSKYWYENHHVALAQSMINGTDRLEDLQMFKEQLDRITEERVIDFNFSEKYGTDYELEFSPLDHFIGTMLLFVAEKMAKVLARASAEPSAAPIRNVRPRRA